jgi:uncharacterized protein (DUF1800 family)
MSVLIMNGGSLRVVPRHSILSPKAGDVPARLRASQRILYSQNAQAQTGRLTRAETSEQQLLEVMSDFWENHFSVFSDRVPSRGSLIEWDRAVIRPHALGRFRDLLGAVAHSAAMLGYLDNAVSTARGLNENYARELLELHTLGVDGGYTQQDIIHRQRASSHTSWRPALWATPRRTPSSTAPRSDLHEDRRRHSPRHANDRNQLGVFCAGDISREDQEPG